MSIRKEYKENSCVVYAQGRISAQNADAFSAALVDAVQECIKVEVDCAGLIYLSSSGLRGMLAAKKIADSKGGVLVLLNVSAETKTLLQLTGFDRLFDFQ